MQNNYDDDAQHSIYDHDEEITSADVRSQDGLLATMDVGGTVLIRSLRGEVEQVLYSLNDMPVDDLSRILLN